MATPAPKRHNPIASPSDLADRKAVRRARALASAIRLKNAYAAEFRKRGDSVTAQALNDCEETKSLMVCYNCQHKFYATTHCRRRVCPVCSYRVAMERKKFLHHLCRRLKHPKLITLTMPAWTGVPKDGVKKLRESVSALRRQKVFRGVTGGAYAIELIPKEFSFHIHIHLLCDAPFIPYQKLFSAWRKILALPHVEVDIRSAGSKEAQYYVAKYVSKPGNGGVDVDKIFYYAEAIKGQRLFGTFGSFYNVTIEELDNETPAMVYKSKCPNCGSEGTCFNARDGPYVLGHDLWELWQEQIIKDSPLMLSSVAPF